MCICMYIYIKAYGKRWRQIEFQGILFHGSTKKLCRVFIFEDHLLLHYNSVFWFNNIKNPNPNDYHPIFFGCTAFAQAHTSPSSMPCLPRSSMISLIMLTTMTIVRGNHVVGCGQRHTNSIENENPTLGNWPRPNWPAQLPGGQLPRGGGIRWKQCYNIAQKYYTSKAVTTFSPLV